MKKIIHTPNGNEVVDLTANELAEFETMKQADLEKQQAKQAEENQKATDKANGNQKLLDLGLTQAEATALTGYTPPAEV